MWAGRGGGGRGSEGHGVTSVLGRLVAPIDIASLVYFRIAFGTIMLWEVWRYFEYGWIDLYWVRPKVNFTYYGFEWIRPWPGVFMHIHMAALGALAAMILLGFCYRVSATLFFVGFTYVFLLEQARYLNHFYFVCLVSFLLILIPAHRAGSLDARWGLTTPRETAPAWALWILRAQIGVVYVFGGLAKLNGDWLRGEPMRMWLARRTDFPILGSFFEQEWMVYAFSFGGVLLDLFIVPLLLWRRTRPYAFGAAVAFHVMNDALFHIGIFPWFSIAMSALFFPPDWPRRLLGGAMARERPRAFATPTWRRDGAVLAVLGAFLAIQVLVPLRHWLYPGNVSWTEQGHNFSWHMKLRTKTARAEFTVTDPASGKVWTVNNRDYLARWQERTMSGKPDMLVQFARLLAEEKRKEGRPAVQVRARVMASLNGRRPQLLIDPTVDLAQVRRSWVAAPWILPLTEPLTPAVVEGDRSTPAEAEE
jgi:vitamin K-dependent gamma-carboxylase-like protein